MRTTTSGHKKNAATVHTQVCTPASPTVTTMTINHLMSQPMVASSGLLSCSRKDSIPSNLGYESRIMDNEKRNAPFCMCIRWCWLTQMLNGVTTFHPYRKCLDCSLPSLPVRSFPFRSSFTIPYASVKDLKIKSTSTHRPQIRRESSKRKNHAFGGLMQEAVRERRKKTYCQATAVIELKIWNDQNGT